MGASEAPSGRLGEIAAAFALLTRIPVARWAATGSMASALWSFPLVGAAVGAIGGGGFAILAAAGTPASVSAACAVIAMILVTGGMHEDGLADACDGLGGTTAAQRLVIMRDERIGTYGAIALVASLAVRISAIAALPGSTAVFAALMASCAASRAAMTVLIAALPPARTEGLSARIGRANPTIAAVAVAIAAVIALAAVGLNELIAMVAATGLVAVFVGTVAQRKIGGQTGDVLGACAQIAECACLIVLVSGG